MVDKDTLEMLRKAGAFDNADDQIEIKGFDLGKGKDKSAVADIERDEDGKVIGIVCHKDDVGMHNIGPHESERKSETREEAWEKMFDAVQQVSSAFGHDKADLAIFCLFHYEDPATAGTPFHATEKAIEFGMGYECLMISRQLEDAGLLINKHHVEHLRRFEITDKGLELIRPHTDRRAQKMGGDLLHKIKTGEFADHPEPPQERCGQCENESPHDPDEEPEYEKDKVPKWSHHLHDVPMFTDVDLPEKPEPPGKLYAGCFGPPMPRGLDREMIRSSTWMVVFGVLVFSILVGGFFWLVENGFFSGGMI